MCELLFILQRISVTNTILSNNVYDISIVCLLLRSLKFWIIYTWSFKKNVFKFNMLLFFVLLLLLLLFWSFCLFVFVCLFGLFVCLFVALNGIKKYLAWPDKINRNSGLPTNLMVNTPPNHNSQKTIACSK